jgi:hypothetical protein
MLQPIPVVEDIAASMLSRGFPSGGLQHVPIGHINEAMSASRVAKAFTTLLGNLNANNPDVTLPTFANELLNIGEFAAIIIAYDGLSTRDEAVESGLEVFHVVFPDVWLFR